MAPSRKISAIDFDKVLQHVGPLGPWQYCHVFLLFLVTLSSGIAVVTFVFTGLTPKHRCIIPQCETIENATYALDQYGISNTQDFKSCQRIVFAAKTEMATDCKDMIILTSIGQKTSSKVKALMTLPYLISLMVLISPPMS